MSRSQRENRRYECQERRFLAAEGCGVMDSDRVVFTLPDGRTLNFGEFLTLLCERRHAEAEAEKELRAAAQKLINAEE